MSIPASFERSGVSSAVVVASGNLTLVSTGATFATGDLVFACISARGNAPFSLPTGWTLVAQEASGNTSTTDSTAIASAVMAYIVWPASAPDLTFTRTGGDVAQGVLVGYKGQAASPIDAVSSATLASNSATAATASITTTADHDLIVAMVAGANDASCSSFRAATDPTVASVGTASPSTNGPFNDTWSELFDATTFTGADTSLAIADVVKTVAGATGELRATHATTSRHVMIAVAVKSAYLDRTSQQISKLSRYDVAGPKDAAISLSKLSRYDVAGPGDDAVSVSKLSRYDIMMAVGAISITKLSRYDILVPPPSTGQKRPVINVNFVNG